MNMYTEHVMDHYKAPHGRGTLTDATVTHKDSNPLCGDTITVQLQIDSTGKIIAAAHQASGCAISQAGASMLFEELVGKSVTEVLAMPNATILDEYGSTISVSRVKCALLGLIAVKKAIVADRGSEVVRVTNN